MKTINNQMCKKCFKELKAPDATRAFSYRLLENMQSIKINQKMALVANIVDVNASYIMTAC